MDLNRLKELEDKFVTAAVDLDYNLAEVATAVETTTDSIAQFLGELIKDLESEDPTPDPTPQPYPDPTPQPGPVGSANVGINMIGAHSWDWYSIFRNAFKESRWVTRYGTPGQYINDIPLGPDGWPSVPIPHNGLRLFADVEINAHTPIVGNKPFTLIQSGPSKIKIAGVGTFTKPQSDSLESLVYFPPTTESANVIIESAGVGSRWELIYPGEESSTSIFHSSVVNSLKPFRIVRAMDTVKTNGSTQVRWSDRNSPTGMSESSDTGSSWASVIALARDTQSDLWINIPHGANSDYVYELSRVMSVFSGKRLFVEYTNEAWNSARAFRPQYDYCRKHGEQRFALGNFLKNLAAGYGDLANTNFEIFRDHYTGQAAVQYVAAWQSAASWTTEYVLDYCPAATAIAHAPYVYDSNWKSDSLDQIFQDMNGANGEGLTRCRKWLERYETLAQSRGLQHMIYECGNHTGGGDNVELSYQVASDPRLTEVLVKFDQLVNEIAGDIPRCYFTLGGKDRRGYTFGHQSHSGDYDDVKWQALMRILGRQ